MKSQLYYQEELNQIIENIRAQIQQKVRKNKFQIMEEKETEQMILPKIRISNKQISTPRSSHRSSEYFRLLDVKRRYTLLPLKQTFPNQKEKQNSSLKIIIDKKKKENQIIKGWTVESATDNL